MASPTGCNITPPPNVEQALQKNLLRATHSGKPQAAPDWPCVPASLCLPATEANPSFNSHSSYTKQSAWILPEKPFLFLADGALLGPAFAAVCLPNALPALLSPHFRNPRRDAAHVLQHDIPDGTSVELIPCGEISLGGLNTAPHRVSRFLPTTPTEPP